MVERLSAQALRMDRLDCHIKTLLAIWGPVITMSDISVIEAGSYFTIAAFYEVLPTQPWCYLALAFNITDTPKGRLGRKHMSWMRCVILKGLNMLSLSLFHNVQRHTVEPLLELTPAQELCVSWPRVVNVTWVFNFLSEIEDLLMALAGPFTNWE